MNKLAKAFELFDDYNKQDHHILIWNDVEYPAEYFYALQLYNWIIKLKPDASEALQLASRAQHIGRWKIPREEYPKGKSGYYKWRTELAKFHAATARELMMEAGYDDEETKPVQHIILKENLKLDDEVQTMENALCLLFLEFQYEDFIKNHDDDMVIRILDKTWKKMSEQGRNAVLSLNFNGRAKELLKKALS
jgi:hypothetical protein